MRVRPVAGASLLASSLILLTTATLADGAKNPPAARAPATGASAIPSATSAAPAAIGKGAAVIAVAADGKLQTLRKGLNNFTCMADNPATPGPDPMCMDEAGMEWVNAWLAHKPPPLGKVGLMYMLAGGTDASNTDPYAAKPEAKNHWIKTGPHIMIVGADVDFYDSYPKTPDPDTTQPYVMWAGTPYEHLMAPVK